MLQLWRLCVDNLLMAFSNYFPLVLPHATRFYLFYFWLILRGLQLTRLFCVCFMSMAGTTFGNVALQPFLNEFVFNLILPRFKSGMICYTEHLDSRSPGCPMPQGWHTDVLQLWS
ncbi:hypothetical protein B0J17DRAFT_647185 [Rhizoctonia solani]|nr:hypothetical protein B0J17DRAFT_647185 [Rhizoctonia solani]